MKRNNNENKIKLWQLITTTCISDTELVEIVAKVSQGIFAGNFLHSAWILLVNENITEYDINIIIDQLFKGNRKGTIIRKG